MAIDFSLYTYKQYQAQRSQYKTAKQQKENQEEEENESNKIMRIKRKINRNQRLIMLTIDHQHSTLFITVLSVLTIYY